MNTYVHTSVYECTSACHFTTHVRSWFLHVMSLINLMENNIYIYTYVCIRAQTNSNFSI